MTRHLFLLLPLLVLAACLRNDQTTSTTDVDLSVGSDSSDTSGDTSTETTTPTTTGVIMGGPCDGLPNDTACVCRATDESFCALLDTFCRVDVGLDLSTHNPPGVDHCKILHDWCVAPEVSTYAVCYLLESTCAQVAPSGDPADCAGLQDTCACDDFASGMTGGGGEAGGETSGGSSTSGSTSSSGDTGVDRENTPTSESDEF